MGRTQCHDDSTLSAEMSAIDTAIEIGLEPQTVVLSLLEQSDDCIKILNVDGNLGYMNCGGLKAMQIDDFKQVAGTKWWDLWPVKRRAMIQQMFERSACGTDIDFIATCPTGHDEDRKWSVKLREMKTGGGKVTGVICTSRDVSEPPAIAH